MQVTYISLQFCAGGRPDYSIGLYKSVDHGATWSPFHFFSDHCRRAFGREFAQRVNRSNEQQPLCDDFGDTDKQRGNSVRPQGGTSRSPTLQHSAQNEVKIRYKIKVKIISRIFIVRSKVDNSQINLYRTVS